MRLLAPALILIGLLSVAACQYSHRKAIDRALMLAPVSPDSALDLLKSINRRSLARAEAARYALAYTLAQDKSGLDVNNDSLLHIAYIYYSARPSDSLYAACMYYTGKYFHLNDSSGRAAYCLRRSAKAAAERRDTTTQCLALGRWARAVRLDTPTEALRLAGLALELYRNYHRATTANLVHYILGKAEALSFCGQDAEALSCSEEALDSALVLGDSTLISHVYQDRSLFACDAGRYAESREYALLSCSYDARATTSKILSLAESHEKAGEDDRCLILLDSLKSSNFKTKFVASYLRLQVALKRRNYTETRAYSDSAIHYADIMYREALNRSNAHHALQIAEHDKRVDAMQNAKIYRLTAGLSITLLLFVLTSTWVAYVSHKRRLRDKIVREQERLAHTYKLRQKDLELTERLQREELRHKEAQINMMRNFLTKKVDIILRLKEQELLSKNHLEIDDQDWKEISHFLENTENNFVSRLRKRYPGLGERDFQFLMLLRLKMPGRVLASIYGISEKSVKQKLFIFKRRIGLGDNEKSLREFIEAF